MWIFENIFIYLELKIQFIQSLLLELVVCIYIYIYIKLILLMFLYSLHSTTILCQDDRKTTYHREDDTSIIQHFLCFRNVSYSRGRTVVPYSLFAFSTRQLLHDGCMLCYLWTCSIDHLVPLSKEIATQRTKFHILFEI